jgi:MFS family permease
VYFSRQHQALNVAGHAAHQKAWSPYVRVSSNVVFLGLTSMFTDVSSEMVATLLPVYLMFELHFTTLQFGIFDGVYQGMTALMRLASGLVADRYCCYKRVASAGYALSTGCKLGLLAAGGAWMPTTLLLFLDRVGKGIRTAPRDTLIALSSPHTTRAEAFGVHRSLDTAGALLGPVVAFGLLSLLPGAFDVVFMASFGAGVCGLGILLLLVDNRAPAPAPAAERPIPALRSVLGLLSIPRFRVLLMVGAALSLLSVSDAFVYLTFQRLSEMNVRFFPLLYLGTALIFLLLAVPVGRLADRVGRRRVFLGGHLFLLGVYGLLLLPMLGPAELVGCFLLLGIYYAATDGVLVALASDVLPQGLLSSGLACLATATTLARMMASVLYGALWSWQGPRAALALFVAGMSVALVLSGMAFTRQSTSAHA